MKEFIHDYFSVTPDKHLKFETQTPHLVCRGPEPNWAIGGVGRVASYKGPHTEHNSRTFPLLLHYGCEEEVAYRTV